MKKIDLIVILFLNLQVFYASENSLSIEYCALGRQCFESFSKFDLLNVDIDSQKPFLSESVKDQLEFMQLKIEGIRDKILRRNRLFMQNFDQSVDDQLLQGFKGSISVYRQDIKKLEQEIQNMGSCFELEVAYLSRVL